MKWSRKARTAYLAGIIDGEGCVTVNVRKADHHRRKTPGYSLKVSISITSFRLVTWLEKYAGLTSVCGYEPKGNRKYKWICTWSNNRAEDILLAVLPYLVIKREVAKVGLELAIHMRTSKSRGGIGNQTSKKDIRYRERLRNKIKHHNRRGRE